MNPFTVLLAALASFFGAGHIPPSVAAKVALYGVLTIAGAIGMALLMMRYGFSAYSSFLAAFFSVLGVFKLWAVTLGGDDDDNESP